MLEFLLIIKQESFLQVDGLVVRESTTKMVYYLKIEQISQRYIKIKDGFGIQRMNSGRKTTYYFKIIQKEREMLKFLKIIKKESFLQVSGLVIKEINTKKVYYLKIEQISQKYIKIQDGFGIQRMNSGRKTTNYYKII